MANTPTSRKRARQNVRRRTHNMTLRSKGRTAIKRVESAIRAKDYDTAMAEFKQAQSTLDALDRKGIFATNMVARHKSRLNRKIKALQNAAA